MKSCSVHIVDGQNSVRKDVRVAMKAGSDKEFTSKEFAFVVKKISSPGKTQQQKPVDFPVDIE